MSNQTKFLVGDLGKTKLMSQKTVKRWSTSLITQELQIKISMSSQHILTGKDAMQKNDNTKWRQECGAVDISSWQKKMQNDQIIELAKRSVQIFLFDVMKRPEQTF